MEKKFYYQDEKSNKFWNISKDALTHTVCYGKAGTDGRETTKEHDSEEKCQKEYDKLIAQKIKKGYVELEEGQEIPEND